MKQQLLGVFFGSLLSSTVTAAGGAVNPVLDDSFTFKLGASWLNVDGTFSSTRDGEPTNKLSTGDLSIDDTNTQAAVSFRWRFTDRWRLTFDYLGLDNDGKVREEFNDFEFGDIKASGFLEVKTKFETDFYIAQVGYSFLKNERAELGIGVGAHVINFDTRVKVSGGIDDVGSGNVQSDTVTLTAPLPNVLGFGTYAFTPKLSVDGSVGWFGLDYNDYSGHLLALTANLDYRITRNFGVGVGYNYFDMDLTIDQSNREDKYDLDYKGPILYVSAAF